MEVTARAVSHELVFQDTAYRGIEMASEGRQLADQADALTRQKTRGAHAASQPAAALDHAYHWHHSGHRPPPTPARPTLVIARA
jgi:hypothetical protein